MIPIRYKKPENDTVNRLCDSILPKRLSTEYKTLNLWCTTNMKCSFRDIVIADYKTLQRLKLDFDGIQGIKTFPYRDYMINTMYGSRFGRCRDIFVEQFEGNLQVCPYCGRNYINKLKNYRQYEIDHFFPKDKYPIFAVSLYNLIPVCPSCNRRKSYKEFSYSPHVHRYQKASQVSHFWYSVTGTGFLEDSSKLKIEMDYIPDMAINVKELDLKQAYNFHKREVQDLLKKASIYSDDYIDDILAKYSNLFASREQVIDFIYGISGDESRFLTETLSKFKTDIYNQIMSGY